MFCMWTGEVDVRLSGFVVEIFMKDPSYFTRHNRRRDELAEHRLISEVVQVIGECQSR